MARRPASPPEPPAIVVGYRPHPRCGRTLHEVCAGIEEEGVHFRTLELPERGAAALAHAAAKRSPLRVGVGVEDGELCVHLAALPADAPLERRAAPAHEPGLARHVGHNAARLVKVLPLKGYGDGEETDFPRAAGRAASQTNDPEVSHT